MTAFAREPGHVPGSRPATGALLDIDALHVAFESPGGRVPAVSGVSLAAVPGRTLCLVGESGCGKTVTGLAVMGLLPPKGKVTSGTIRFAGKTLDPAGTAALGGRDIAMIFQNPVSSLNPVHTVGAQLCEVLTLHRGMGRREARTEAGWLLETVGIADPAAQLARFPHQLSGGMAQRVMIAIALACRPRLLIADEPTTALDVTIQAQILDLLRSLQADFGTTIVLITHDLGIVAEMAHDVAVMYCGEVVETAPVNALFAHPRHPYTRALLASRPRIDRRKAALAAIPGTVPPPAALPPGCRFAPRCARADAVCNAIHPPLEALQGPHRAACHHPEHR